MQNSCLVHTSCTVHSDPSGFFVAFEKSRLVRWPWPMLMKQTAEAKKPKRIVFILTLGWLNVNWGDNPWCKSCLLFYVHIYVDLAQCENDAGLLSLRGLEDHPCHGHLDGLILHYLPFERWISPQCLSNITDRRPTTAPYLVGVCAVHYHRLACWGMLLILTAFFRVPKVDKFYGHMALVRGILFGNGAFHCAKITAAVTQNADYLLLYTIVCYEWILRALSI